MGPYLAPMTSLNPNKGIEIKMATTDLDNDPCDISTSYDPVTCSVTPQRVSQHSRQGESRVTFWAISFLLSPALILLPFLLCHCNVDTINDLKGDGNFKNNYVLYERS